MYCTRDYYDIIEDGWFDCLNYIECEECPYWGKTLFYLVNKEQE